MKKISINLDEEILEIIKKTILERYPIIKDRTDIFESKNEFEIDIVFYETEDNEEYTKIIFLDGTESYRTSIDEKINADYRLLPNFVINLISFILKDYSVVTYFNKTSTDIEFKFGIDWYINNQPGISCRKISVNLDFNYLKDKDKLIDSYFKTLLIAFFNKLKDTPFIKREMSEYIGHVTRNFATNASDEEIRTLFEKLSINDLRNIIYDINMNNANIFFNAYSEMVKDKEKGKRLELH